MRSATTRRPAPDPKVTRRNHPPAHRPRAGISGRRAPLTLLTMVCALISGLLLPATAAAAAPANTAPLAPNRLTVDDAGHPLNTSLKPRFGWLPQDNDSNEIQSAYELEVTNAGGAVVWTSAKVSSTQQAYIPYAGPTLSSGSAYTWKVRTWDRSDEVSPWSDTATFETGLQDADWGGAEWIKRPPGNPDAGPLKINNGRARYTGSASAPLIFAATGSSWTDYTVEMNVTPVSGGTGIVFRGQQSTPSGYMWQLIPGTGLRPHSFTGSTYTKYSDVPMSIVTGTSYAVKIEVTGTTIKTSINGTLVDTRTPAATWGAGTIGFREAGSEIAEFDDVKVTAADGTVLFSDDFSAGLGKWALSSLTLAQEPDEWTLARTEVDLPAGQIVRARSYVAGSHTYELWVNGQRADRGSSFTYTGEGYYQAADITSLVHGGQRLAIGSILHWYSGSQGRVANSPGLLIRVVLEYADGTRKVVVSNGSWKTKRGPYINAGARGSEGDFVEQVDGPAMAALGTWTSSGYDDSTWANAISLGAHPTSTFSHLNGLETRMAETVVHPVRMLTASDGTPVADFGNIIPARPGVHFDEGVSGRVITMRASYKLASSGRVSTSTTDNQSTDMRFPYTQVSGAQDYQAFTHLGFRYLEIPGANETIGVEDVTATVVHTAYPTDGAATFDSSDPTLNGVWDLMQRSARYSVQETFVDTPTREKGQFLADTANISYALMGTSYDRMASRQAMKEFLLSQQRYWTTGTDAGRYNAVYPNNDGKRDIPDFTELVPNWVWRYYLQTGDRDMLELAYPAIVATAGYVKRAIPSSGTTQGLVTQLPGGSGQYQYGIVDWPAAGRFGYDMNTTARTTVNALAVDVLRNTAAIGTVLGRPTAEIQGFTSDADALAGQMNAKLRRADGVYVDGLLSSGAQSSHAGQHATSYAVAFGIAPAADRPALATYLASMGMKQGPMTAHWLLDALGQGGATPAVLTTLTNTQDLGWAKVIANGGTFTPEAWVHDANANSLSHGWGSQSIVDMQEQILGIKVTAPGAAEVRLSVPNLTLSHAAGTMRTQRGIVSLDWTRQGNQVSLTAAVPVNVSATIELPTAPAGTFYKVTGGTQAEALGTTNGVERFRVGSGTWTFQTTADIAPAVTAATDPVTATGSDGWFTGAVKAVLAATDDRPGDVLVEYRLGDGSWSTYTAPVELPEGISTVTYRATDTAGNVSTDGSLTVKRDATAPIVSGSLSGRTVTVTGADTGSGIAGLEYRLDDSATWSPYASPVIVDNAAHTVWFRAVDNAGNISVAGSIAVPAVSTGQVPGVPTGLTVALGDATSRLTWVAPANSGSSSITGYTVTASPGGKTCTTTGALTCRIDGLTNGTSYTFTVTATNAAGTSAPSIATAPATPTFPPGTTANVSVSVSAKTQCINSKTSLPVYVLNKEAVPVNVVVSTAFGSQSASLAAGKAAYLTFAPATNAVADGNASILATKTVNGTSVSTTYQAGYLSLTCG